MTDVVTGYQLGPIAVGADSPLGQLFGGLAGLSQNYGTGLAAAINDPRDVQSIFSGQQVTPAQVQSIKDASAAPLSGNPVTQSGQILGTWLGSGVDIIGSVLGIGGKTATPGVVAGVGSAAGGVSSVATGGLVAGLTGAVGGGLSGVSAALAGSGGGNFLLIGGAILLAIAFLYLI
jgi:hypothetical protein